MNKIYRIVWNAALNVWQCVAEIAVARGKSKSQSAVKTASGGVDTLVYLH